MLTTLLHFALDSKTQQPRAQKIGCYVGWRLLLSPPLDTEATNGSLTHLQKVRFNPQPHDPSFQRITWLCICHYQEFRVELSREVEYVSHTCVHHMEKLLYQNSRLCQREVEVVCDSTIKTGSCSSRNNQKRDTSRGRKSEGATNLGQSVKGERGG